MITKRRTGFLVGGIITGMLSIPAWLLSAPFIIVGLIFRTFPSGVHVTFNGHQLQGQAAVDMALKIGNTFTLIGCGAIGAALLCLLLGAILLLMYYLVKKRVYTE